MTILRRPKRHDPERHVVLRCDYRSCPEREEFSCNTDFATVSKWAKAHNWRIIHRGGHLWDHRCPRCDLLSIGGEAYLKQLHA